MTGPAPRARPRKRFGQHFLEDASVIDRLVAAIQPRPTDRLVEVGPGPGALTRPLLERAGVLIAIELDRDLAPRLQGACGPVAGRLTVRQEDVLRTDWAALAGDGPPLRVVGNLPYNISSPLLFRLLDAARHIHDMHFMLQKEVVDRICAPPGSRRYGRLTVALHARAGADALFDVPAEAFRPPPKVESAVVRLVPRPPPYAVADLRAFDTVLRHAFSHRRKTLGNALRGVLARDAIAGAGIDPSLRPEHLPPEGFAALAALLA